MSKSSPKIFLKLFNGNNRSLIYDYLDLLNNKLNERKKANSEAIYSVQSIILPIMFLMIPGPQIRHPGSCLNRE